MVANALKGGHQIEPEVFDSATVYFSSVIGFNDVTLNKKPVVIVDTLNMIYRLMDDTISHYDAYKVETVLDSYLIVSGLPTRNGIQHASQMADLSLKMQQV
uniref:Guanylate cyclase domain-containing protein n=1 Tax=Romanomermis culicivorax TaxID=13658 RepID=A0A915HQ27_ROMCU